MLYTGEQLREISFPVGGIGSGCIGLGGNGQIKDFEIFNRPNKGSLNGYTHIAVRCVKDGKCIPRILNGDNIECRTGQYSGQMFGGFGFGRPGGSMAGFPHFAKNEFKGEFPYACLTFSEGGFPAEASLKAFNPMIPLDEDNSSLPAAFYEVTLKNTDTAALPFSAAFTFKNPFEGKGLNVPARLKNGAGVFMYNSVDEKSDPAYGDITIACDDENAFCQASWYRGGWQDSIATYWNEFSSGERLRDRSYDTPAADHATIVSEFTLAPGESKTVRFIVAWNIPNMYNYWSPLKDSDGKDVTWKNHYATRFASSSDTADYALSAWDGLDRRTTAFHDALFSSTLAPEILDAVSATMSVLKSPTVLRLEDGSFYGFEGCHEKSGCCEGTCEHVWNYAYALPFLFPRLEKSIRDLEFKYATDENGDMEFRLKLPPDREFTRFRPCVDGQMGSVIKTYREWKISGDTQWLKQVFPTVKKVIEFAWSDKNRDEWDRDKDGVLEGRQHHTLDMELFGPSSWLEGFYLAALKAASLMAEELGETDKAKEYAEVYEKGRAYANTALFNGKYFIHNVTLEDKARVEHFDALNYWNDETGEIKYQIGEGSSIDQLCAQWHADIVGLGRIFDKDKTDIALDTMMKENFKPSMREFANPWRLFAMNDEAGSIICVYPEGARKPKIPVPYCEESMHGFEYQFAGLLTAEGRKEDGLRVVEAVRGRYDGKYRNPWNEIECGSNYARSMASFALLPITSGFVFDLPHGMMGFDPIDKGDFNCLWSLGTGWGSLGVKDGAAYVKLAEGRVELEKLYVPFVKAPESVTIDGKPAAFTAEDGYVVFKKTEIGKEIVVK